QRSRNVLSLETFIIIEQILIFRPLCKSLKDELDGDSSSLKNRLAEHHMRVAFDVLFPVGHGITFGPIIRWAFPANPSIAPQARAAPASTTSHRSDPPRSGPADACGPCLERP